MFNCYNNLNFNKVNVDSMCYLKAAVRAEQKIKWEVKQSKTKCFSYNNMIFHKVNEDSIRYLISRMKSRVRGV